MKDEDLVVKTNNTALCLTCKENLSVFKDHHLKRLYLQKHAAKFGAYHGMLCKDKIDKLKNAYHVNKIKTQMDTVTNVGYLVANLIAKNSKPFTDGD